MTTPERTVEEIVEVKGYEIGVAVMKEIKRMEVDQKMWKRSRDKKR